MALTKISGGVIQTPVNVGVVTATRIDGDINGNVNSTGVSTFSTIKVGTAVTISGGIVTATTFSGNLTGNVTGNATGLSETPNITVGSITAASATFSGNVSVAGTVTYEDVTNVDSVGVVTARSGVRITDGGLVVTAGVSTFTGSPVLIGSGTSTGTASQKLQVAGSAYVSDRLGIGITNTNTGSGNTLIDSALTIAGSNNSKQLFIPYNGTTVAYAGFGVSFASNINASGAADYTYITLRPAYGAGVASGPDVPVIQFNNTYNRNYPDVVVNPLGGNIGVGLTNPFSKLQVNFSSSTAYSPTASPQTTNSITLFNTDTTATTTFSSIALGNRRNGNGAFVGIECVGTGNDATALVFKTQSAGPVFAEVMRLTSTGRVGIGTDSIADKVVIVDSMAKVAASSGWGIVVSDSNIDGVAGRGGAIAFGARRTDGGNFNCGAISGAKSNSTGLNENGDLVLWSSVSSSLTERMRILSGGNVGVGSATPGFQLTVDQGTTDGNLFQLKNEELGLLTGVWGTGSTYPREVTLNATRVDSGSFPSLRLAGQGGIKFAVDLNTVQGTINSYGEFRIGTAEDNAVSTDRVHTIGGVSIASVQTNLARLVMQERVGNWISFKDGSGTHFGTISRSGGGVSYGSNSDYRLKENVLPLSNSIEKVKNLKPVSFNFISSPDVEVDGFLAHEVQEVAPYAVTGEKDGYDISGDVLDSDGKIIKSFVPEPSPEKLEEGQTWVETSREVKIQQLDSGKLVPLLTAALQEALSEIETLKARLDAAGL